MLSNTKKLWRLYGVTMLIATGIFIVLYFPYLSEQYLYAYLDIGSDTITTYLPNTIFDVKSILQGEFSSYTLYRGLGGYYGNPLYQYLNVVNLPLLLLGEKHLHWALLAAAYLKYAAICFFGLLFFRRLLRDDRLASICALLWTYSGYAVLWGQHYQFLTAIVFITVSMYGVQLFLENDRKRFLLIPALASLAFISYYWLYIGCYLFAAYSIGYLVFRKAGVRTILKKAGIFALGLLLAVGIAGGALFPNISGFFKSTRTSDVLYGTNSHGFFVYPIKYLLTFLARLLSNDTLGVGNSFSGTKNYYEAAILSVSVLFIFMLILLLQSKQWKRVAICVGICAIALCLGPVSQILNFSDENQRWSLICCFFEIVLIGMGLKYLFCHAKQPDFPKTLFRTVLIADGVYLFVLALLWFARGKYGISLKARTCVMIIMFLLLYSLFFLLELGWKRHMQSVVLVILVAVELVAMNYCSINERARVTFNEWYGSMYYDGTEGIVDWIQNKDDSLYRINKCYNSVSYNDALMQGYRGMAVYSSTNTKELVNLYTSFGNSLVDEKYPNWIRFPAGDDVVNTLLGVKYLIAPPESKPNRAMYKEICNDGIFQVYENQFDLGFGYLYRNQLPQWQVETLQPIGRHLALTESYFFSDEEITNPEPVEIEGIKGINMIPYFKGAINCEAEVYSDVLYVYASGSESEDMQLYFNCDDLPEGWSAGGMTVELSVAEASISQVFVAANEEGYSEERSATCAAQEGEGVYYFNLSGLGTPLELRFDPANLSQDVEIKSITLQLINDETILNNLAELRENRITDFSQDRNTFTGSITNPWDEDAMLCIPLIYSDHWRAEVDGETAEVRNINGGLVGIGVNSGSHEISITYYDNAQQIGQIVGLVSFLIYAAGAVIWWKRKGKYETPVDICARGDEMRGHDL